MRPKKTALVGLLRYWRCDVCSHRVIGVDGSCAKHLTVESYRPTVIYAANSYTYYY